MDDLTARNSCQDSLHEHALVHTGISNPHYGPDEAPGEGNTRRSLGKVPYGMPGQGIRPTGKTFFGECRPGTLTRRSDTSHDENGCPGIKQSSKSSKVLLISANRCTKPDPVFPLGLASIHSALRQAGHQTEWIDLLVNEERLEKLLDSSWPDYIGISLRNIDDVLIRKKETYFGGLASLIANIRIKTKAPIILGGSGFSIFPRDLFELTDADFGVCGAGEASLVWLINSLNNGQHYQDIPGLVYRWNGKIVINPACEEVQDRSLTCVEWPETITSYYLGNGGMLNLRTQRGCHFRCCYCTYPLIDGKRHLRRSPEIVADDLDRIQKLGTRYVCITDSIFNSSELHASEICEAILRRNIKISWCCFLRPQGLTPDLMRLMVRAGLSHVEFGSDSFCDEVLSAYGKDFSFDDIVHSSELAKQQKIDFCHFLIAGGPGESLSTLDITFRNAQRLVNPIVLAVVGMRIYPGTALFERAVKEGVLDKEADLLNPAYYVAPGLSSDTLFEKIREFAAIMPGWIVGDTDPVYYDLVRRFRKRGVVGPLWSYFAMMQRIRPQDMIRKVST